MQQVMYYFCISFFLQTLMQNDEIASTPIVHIKKAKVAFRPWKALTAMKSQLSDPLKSKELEQLCTVISCSL